MTNAGSDLEMFSLQGRCEHATTHSGCVCSRQSTRPFVCDALVTPAVRKTLQRGCHELLAPSVIACRAEAPLSLSTGATADGPLNRSRRRRRRRRLPTPPPPKPQQPSTTDGGRGRSVPSSSGRRQRSPVASPPKISKHRYPSNPVSSHLMQKLFSTCGHKPPRLTSAPQRLPQAVM